MGQKKEYQKSCELWIKAQENIIEEIKASRENSIKMIDIHSKALMLQEESIKHEESVLLNFKNRRKNE